MSDDEETHHLQLTLSQLSTNLQVFHTIMLKQKDLLKDIIFREGLFEALLKAQSDLMEVWRNGEIRDKWLKKDSAAQYYFFQLLFDFHLTYFFLYYISDSLRGQYEKRCI